MTKKDFELIAEALRIARPSKDGTHDGTLYGQWETDVLLITAALRAYPDFDNRAFVKACME